MAGRGQQLSGLQVGPVYQCLPNRSSPNLRRAAMPDTPACCGKGQWRSSSMPSARRYWMLRIIAVPGRLPGPLDKQPGLFKTGKCSTAESTSAGTLLSTLFGQDCDQKQRAGLAVRGRNRVR